MQYFKHTELAKQYHVSLKTVHNWIAAAKNNRLDLRLHTAKSGTYVANTNENTQLLEVLSEKGKKYRNTLHHKTVQPQPGFYDIYSKRQILDMINNIDIHREIPGQYNYLEEGARNWDSWMHRLAKDDTSNLLKGSIQLIDANIETIERLIKDSARINVVDLGVGNAFPVRNLLQFLLKKEVLHRYIAIDISKTMLDVAQKNIEEWFDKEVQFEGHVRDMTFERFDDLLVEDMLDEKAEDTVNIVLLLGATATNFRSFSDAISLVYKSMGKNDILIYTDKLDTEASRRYFDFGLEKESSHAASRLPEGDRYILDLLGVDESLYSVEAGFNQQKHMRYIQIRLNTAITIEFVIEGGKHRITLEKDDAILLLRILHQTAYEIISTFEKIGLGLLQASLSEDRQYFLSISGVNAKQSD